MNRKALCVVFALFCSSIALGQNRGISANKPTCTTTAPQLFIVIDGATATDCTTGGGSSQVLCLCSGGSWAAVVSSALPQHLIDYSPDRAPTSCAACEEFTDGALSQTWTWGNQSSATETLAMDGATINFNGATGRTVRWLASPGAVNWTATMKARPGYNASGSGECVGMAVLESGTIATPTAFREFLHNNNGVDAWRVYGLKLSSYSAYVSTDTPVWAVDDLLPVYIQARYTTSTKGLVWAWSHDGMTWTTAAGLTLAADPTYIGRETCTAASIHQVDFFRVRTDANRNLSGE